MAALDDLYRSSPVAQAVLDFDTHRVVSVNPEWERLFGYTLEEARGRDGVLLRTWAREEDRRGFVERLLGGRRLGWQVALRRRRSGEAFEALTAVEEAELEGRRYYVTTIVDVSARARAAEASARLAALFRSTPVAHCIIDAADGRYADANAAYARMFGLAPGEIAGRTAAELGIFPDEDERLRSFTAVRAAPAGSGLVGQRRRRSGEMFHVSMSWDSIALEGRTYRVYSLLDVTAEIAGRRSIEQLSRFFRSSPTAHLISRLDDGRYVEVNEAYERMFGFRRDEVVGRTTLERGVPFEPGVRAAFAERLRRQGRLQNERIRTTRRDGSPIEVLFSAEPIELEGVPCLLVTLADVTGEARAKVAEERLAKFFRSSPVAHGISRMDDGTYVEVNEAWSRMYGYPAKAAIGRTSADFGVWLNAADRQRFVAELRATGRVLHFAHKARRSSGEVFDAQISGELIELDGAQHLLWSVVDVTALVESRELLEQRVRARTAELQAANEELSAFSYSVSHDMRAPVRAVIGFASILLEDHGAGLSPDARRLVERIAAESGRMGELIDAMLEFSRLMRRPIERRQVDLSALATRLLDELRERDPGRRVEVAVQPGLTASADPVLIRSVLGNLFDNAWKYTGRTPAARIEFGCDDDGYYVRDNGAGFDMAYVGKLFKPFERLHATDEFPGTGIGLATVERILRRHGGNVVAEGAPGKGATIYFSIPG